MLGVAAGRLYGGRAASSGHHHGEFFFLDAIGLVMGLLTIPMALLSFGSIAAGIALLGRGDWRLVLFGFGVFLLSSALARLFEQVVIAIDDAAAMSLARGRRARAYGFAALSGALPTLLILIAEIGCLVRLLHFDPAAPAPALLEWLWAYGVATGPWTLFALRVSRFRRTLVGIRAYAAHLALWLFSLLALVLHVAPAAAAAAMLLPAILPFTVGLLLALADRDAIVNVRV